MYSAQKYARFYHLDIPDLSDEDLSTEFYSLRSMLYWLPPNKMWIAERIKELGKEYGRRHYAEKQQQSTRLSNELPTGKVLRKVDL
jgi:hypothetical protein